MNTEDIREIMLYLVGYCAPAAFVINLTGYAVRVVVDAVTGRGLKL